MKRIIWTMLVLQGSSYTQFSTEGHTKHAFRLKSTDRFSSMAVFSLYDVGLYEKGKWLYNTNTTTFYDITNKFPVKNDGKSKAVNTHSLKYYHIKPKIP
jgi:hypothetical protein